MADRYENVYHYLSIKIPKIFPAQLLAGFRTFCARLLSKKFHQILPNGILFPFNFNPE